MSKFRKKRNGVGIACYAVQFVYFTIIAAFITIGVLGTIEINQSWNNGALSLKGNLPTLRNIEWRNPDKPHPKAKKLPHTWKHINGRKVDYWCYGQSVRFIINKGSDNEVGFTYTPRETDLNFFAGRDVYIRTITMLPTDSTITQWGRIEKK